MLYSNFTVSCNGGQIYLAVPFFQFVREKLERPDVFLRKRNTHDLRSLNKCFTNHLVSPSGTNLLFALSATDSTEMAAGVTPGMREACPRVSGRIFAIFSRTSVVRPLIE